MAHPDTDVRRAAVRLLIAAWAVALPLTLVPLAAGQARPKPVSAPERSDLHGAPLPPFALARMGTAHRRPTDLEARPPDPWDMEDRGAHPERDRYQVQVSEDRVRVVDARTQRAVFWGSFTRILDPGPTTVGQAVLSPDGKLLAVAVEVVKQGGGYIDTAGGPSVVTSLHLRRVSRWDRLRPLSPDAIVPIRLRDLEFSPDGRKLVGWGGGFVLWDLGTRKWVVTVREIVGEATPPAFSPDGRTFAYAATWRRGDGFFSPSSIFAYDTGDGQPRFTIEATEGGIRRVWFTPDGRRLMASGVNGTLAFDARTGEDVTEGRRPGHTGEIVGLAFSPDGKRLLSVGEKDRSRVWETATGAPVLALKERYRLGTFAGSDFLVAATEQEVQLLDARTGQPLGKIPIAAGSAVRALASSGATVAALVSPDTVKLFRASAGGIEPRFEAAVRTAGSDYASALRFSPDGELLAVAAAFEHGLVKASSGALLREWRSEAEGAALAFARGGTALASSSCSSARVWEVASGRALHTLEKLGGRGPCALAPDGALLATARGDKIRLVDTGSGDARELEGHAGDVTALAFSPDGSVLASGSADASVLTWDVAAATRKVRAERVGADGFELGAGAVEALAFSPDAARLAWGAGPEVGVLELASGAEAFRVGAKELGHVRAVLFYPFRQILFFGSDDGYVHFLDPAFGHEQRVVQIGSPVLRLAMAGAWLAVGDDFYRRVVEVKEVETARELDYLRHGGRPLAFSLAQGRVATFSSELGTIQVQDLESDKTLFRQETRDGPATAAAFSADGRLVAWTEGGRIRIAEAATGQAQRSLAGHEGAAAGVAFLPDGRMLVSWGEDRAVRFWGVEGGVLLFEARTRSPVGAVAVAPDGSTVAVAEGSIVRVWRRQDLHRAPSR